MLGLLLLTAGLADCGGGEENINIGGHSISGTITVSTNGVGLSNVSLTLFGCTSGNKFTDFNGSYLFSGLPDGTCDILPSKTGYTFLPPLLTVTINGASLTDQNFQAYATAAANLTTLDSTDVEKQPKGPHADTAEPTDFP
ncbi:MAG: carboxypeptidase-like regulatory domain-containing protein [Syntrophales bacterium]